MSNPDAFTWSLVYDLRVMWSFPFMVNAYRAGTLVALAAGVVGYFVVLRKQTFTAHTLAVVGFPGASAALLAGLSVSFGYLGLCIAGALLLAALGRGGRGGFAGESAVTGTLQAVMLGAGYLFATLYHGFSDEASSLLFGNFLGVSATEVLVLAAGTAVVLAAMAAIGRPLLAASVDPLASAAHGVPVRGLAAVFLVLVGVAVAQAGQITGALLVFALVVVPAATARELTARPGRAVAISVGLACAYTWVGLLLGFYWPYPVGFFITTLAFVPYAVVRATRVIRAGAEAR